MKLILKWLLIGVAIYYIPYLIPGISVVSYVTALIFALVLTVLHYTLKPILFVLTLPINILTLGLFSIILNTIVFSVAAYLIDGFKINGFIAALLGAIVVSLVGHLIDAILSPRKKS